MPKKKTARKKTAKKRTKKSAPRNGITIDVKEFKTSLSAVQDALGPISAAMALPDVECNIVKREGKSRLVYVASSAGAYFRQFARAEGGEFAGSVRTSSFKKLQTPHAEIRFEPADGNQIFFQSGAMKGHVPCGTLGIEKPKFAKPTIDVDGDTFRRAVGMVAFKSPMYAYDPNKVLIRATGDDRLYLESHDPYTGCCCTIPCEKRTDAPLNVFVESGFLAGVIKHFSGDVISLGSDDRSFALKDNRTFLQYPNVQQTSKQETGVLDKIEEILKSPNRDSIEFDAKGLAAAAGCSFSVAFDLETEKYHEGLVRISANKRMNFGTVQTGDGKTGVSTTFDLISIATEKKEIDVTLKDSDIKMLLGSLASSESTWMIVVEDFVIFVDDSCDYKCLTTQTQKVG